MWKTDENGNLVVQDGNPVIITADGKEEVFSLDKNKEYIDSLKAESIGRRKELSEIKEQFKAYEGLDPQQAREALEKLQKLSDKELIDAGKVDEVKAEMKKVYEAQLNDERSKAVQLENQLKSYIIGQSFGDSRFIQEKLNIPVDMAREFFGKHFTVNERNQVIALHDPSNPDSVIYSEANPGEPAGFDEALAKFVNSYQFRDQILKPSGNQGAGTTAGRSTGNTPKSLADCKTEAEKLAYLKTIQ